MNPRNILIIFTVLVLALASAFVIFLARGYQLDIKTAKVSATGILVATSEPDGAEVVINGKLATATNTTINLPPSSYTVKIQKDGFSPWQKDVTITKEEVIKTSAFLFPNLPELRPLTLTGAKSPSLSPDGSKIAYFVASASAEKNGLWILDMSRPTLTNGLFSSSDFRLISQANTLLPLSVARILWGTDSKQILLYTGDHTPSVASPSAKIAYLLDTDRINEVPTLATFQLPSLLAAWQTLENARYQAEISKLSPKFLTLLATSSSKLDFSPDQNRILYQATASATIPTVLQTYLPGTNPTPQTRTIKPGNIYVYDIKEDRNYLITSNQLPATSDQIVWFPSSRHLLSFTDKEISVVEYDGSNKAVIYAGPFAPGVVFPWPNWSKIVILTSLNDSSGVGENLYTINLR